MVVGLHFVVLQASAFGVRVVVLVGTTRSGKGGGGGESGGMGTAKGNGDQVQKQYWYHVVGVVSVSSCCE